MSSELDTSQFGSFTPSDVIDQYRSIVPRVAEANPHLQLPAQGIYEHIKAAEKATGARLYGVNLSPEASLFQAMTFNRKLLRLRSRLNIATDVEKETIKAIDADFASAANKLSASRNVSLEEADDILMNVLNHKGLTSIDDAIERLTKGPKINGFEKTDLSIFDFTNEEIGEMLTTSFGTDPILNSRILEITKVPGFPVQCPDVQFGNECIPTYNARWAGGFLVLPTREAYEQVAMKLEGVATPADLQHTFKLRASTDSGGRFATIKVYEFVVEKPSHFDYLNDLPFKDEGKMQAYFLGIVAHEASHAMQNLGISQEVSNEYRALAKNELSDTLSHQFVTTYVDRHHLVYKSGEGETLNEDFAEAIRMYLTNAEYLKKHFPKRYQFIQEKLPFVQENAILHFVANRHHNKVA